MSEGATPEVSGNVQASEPLTARALFQQLEAGADDGQPDDEEQAQEQEEADAEPQGEPKSDEGEDVEAKAEDEQPEDGESEDEEPAEKTVDDTATVEIDGNKVTVEELKLGYLRESDYTRKTMALAEERREMDQAVERVSQLDASARKGMELAEQVLAAIIPPAPDPTLLQSDPQSYLIAKEQREQYLAVVNSLRQQKEQADKVAEAERSAQLRKFVEAEAAALPKVFPEFASSEGRDAFRKEAIEYGAKHWGLTAQDIDGVISIKQLHVLRDAVAYRKQMAKKEVVAAKVKAAPPLVKPAPRAPDARQDRLSKLRSLGAKARPRDIFLELEKV